MNMHIEINSFDKRFHYMPDTMQISGATDVNQTDDLLQRLW